MKQFIYTGAGGRAILVQKYQVRRETLLAHHSTSEVIGVADVVVLELFGRDALEVRRRQEQRLPFPSTLGRSSSRAYRFPRTTHSSPCGVC